MNICTKCGIDKPIEEYETYWHSTQNKTRTRRYCRDCCKEQRRLYRESIRNKKITQPVSPEPPTIHYSTLPDYYNCIDCNNWKHISDFYQRKDKKPLNKKCKDCQRECDRMKAEQKRIDNGGSLMVPFKPNVYFDKYQKENTFELMGLMGYLYDEETGIWWKPGVKEIVDGKPVFLKISKQLHGRPRKITREVINQMIEMRNKKWTFAKIGIKLDLSESTIQKYISLYGKIG